MSMRDAHITNAWATVVPAAPFPRGAPPRRASWTAHESQIA